MIQMYDTIFEDSIVYYNETQLLYCVEDQKNMFQLLLAIIYLAFISLGLPDPLLGAAWPAMHGELGVPISYAGGISMIIAIGTVISSLQSDRMTKWLGTGKVTAISVATTAIALFGFSSSHSFWQLCLWAIPYGLGAGSVDASLNNYVALHYASRHMSWLHCMWGVGTSIGPYVMGRALTGGMSWNTGYRLIGFLQIGLTLILLCSLPLWKKPPKVVDAQTGELVVSKPLTLQEILKIQGVKEVMLAFFCYCALEQTAMLWGSSYFVGRCGLDADRAATLASMFCIGITTGRAISGFLTIRFDDKTMIRMGVGIILLGIVCMFLPFGTPAAMTGLILVGLGCAPIYPCVIHSTPAYFGADKSQAIIGIQMASAYVGTCLMPPIFGLIAGHVSVALLPVYLLVILVILGVMHERLVRKKG